MSRHRAGSWCPKHGQDRLRATRREVRAMKQYNKPTTKDVSKDKIISVVR